MPRVTSLKRKQYREKNRELVSKKLPKRLVVAKWEVTLDVQVNINVHSILSFRRTFKPQQYYPSFYDFFVTFQGGMYLDILISISFSYFLFLF